MSELITCMFEEASLLAMTGGWNGEPKEPPHIQLKAWFIDPYWYVATTNGVHRCTTQDKVESDEDLIFTAGEQVRILLLPQYRQPYKMDAEPTDGA